MAGIFSASIFNDGLARLGITGDDAQRLTATPENTVLDQTFDDFRTRLLGLEGDTKAITGRLDRLRDQSAQARAQLKSDLTNQVQQTVAGLAQIQVPAGKVEFEILSS